MKAYKKWSLVGLIASASMAICAITFSHTSFSSSAFKKGNASEYTLTLNSSNSYSTGSEQSITTDSGDYQVVFSYSSCVSASSAHALINDGGTIINKDHIRSISKLQATYTGGKLKARTSYDRSTWGEYFELSSGFEYSFGSYPYYVELKAFDAVTLTSAKFSYTCLENAAAHEGETPKGEELLGVINFWNENNADDTTTSNLVDKDYVDAVSYTDSTFTKSASIVSSIDATRAFKDRYGGIGFGNKSSGGSLDLNLNSKYHTDKVVVKVSKYENGGTMNSQSIPFTYTGETTDLANSTTLTFNYNSLQSSISFETTKRVALYQVFLYNTNGDSQIEYDTPKDEVGFIATDSNQNNYLENSVFDTANGLSVSALFSDGTSETLAESAYSYKIYNSLEQEIDTSKAFGSAGAYTLKIIYKNYLPQVINLDVGEYVYLTGVTASMTTTTFTTADNLSANLSGNITANKTYNYTKYNETNIAYSNFATKHLDVKLFNPSDTEYSISTAFTTPGSWKVRIISSEDNTKYADISITVNAIAVTGVTLSSTAVELVEEQTTTLTATVTPNNATDKTVTWSSNKESVATVNNGVVTAVKEGSATITATANDGSGAYATCAVTVTAKPATTTATITVNKTWTSGNTATPGTSDFSCKDITVSGVDSEYLYGSGNKSLRFSSSSNGGYLTFTFNSSIIVGIKLYATKFGSDSSAIKVVTSANQTGQSKSLGNNDNLVFDGFENDKTASTSLTISSAKNNRFYLTKVELTILPPQPIYPTSISLSGNSEVGIGNTTTLTVSYTPSTTNQKTVTWESGNTSVATVNNGVVTGVATGSTTITAKALKQDKSYALANFNITVTETPLDPYTILIYLCGSNLESSGGQATGDITEMLSANIPSGINIAIETGGSTKWKKYSIPNNKLGRYHISGTSLVNDAYLTNASMGEQSTFESFLQWGLETYPAQQTGVILWNHGGAMSGCCSDDNFDGDTLSPVELHTACKNVFQTKGIEKLDWIGYDCCLMGVGDIASLNADYFDYMIASEESEWGDGWAYDDWLPTLKANPSIQPSDLLPVICETFVDYYDTAYSGYGPEDNNQTLSVLDLSKMNTFVTAFNDYVDALNINSSTKWNKIKTAYNSSLKFGYDEDTDSYSFGVADFKSWLDNMKTQFSSIDQTALLEALSELIICNEYGGWYNETRGIPCGLCMVYTGLYEGIYPEDGKRYNFYWGSAEDYGTDCTKFSSWQKINDKYSDGLYRGEEEE